MSYLHTHRSELVALLLTLALIVVGLAASPPAAAQPGTFYVATSGSDTPAAGTAASPWATIGYAITRVPDGSTILVRSGEYSGQVRLDRSFAQGVTVRSEQPYQARLRHSAQVVIIYNGQGITLEGFDIAHSGAGASALVVHIQNLRSQGVVSRITLRNNIIHDSYNNDILKINNGAEQITVSGNLFYNQTGSDEHIDINSVREVVVQDNIFLNDFAGSGRSNANNTSAYVVIKDSNGNDDGLLGSRDITLRRNIFLSWEGSVGYGFVQVGEDGTANYEADGVLLENNLLLGNAANRMRAPFAVMGSRNVTIRHNTVSGDLPSSAFGMRLYRFGDNQPNADLRFYNNLWSDPGGTMSTFSDTPQGETSSFILNNNLYWNGGQPLPNDPADLVNITDDDARVLADPRLGSQAGLVPPRWSGSQFADGSATIRQAFERLATSYGTPGAGSAALDKALPAQAPADDLLGNPRPRGAAPDLGALEVQQGTPPPPPPVRDKRLFLALLRR
jgi:hypothetical protein